MVSKKAIRSKKKQRNGWDVLNTFVEGVFQLFNSNKIYPAFGLVILFLVSIILWRLPESELADIIKIVLNEVLVGKSTLLLALIVSNIIWMFLFQRQKKLYEKEIERLSLIRSELMHSPRSIANHRSSKDANDASILIPAPEVQD